MHMGLGTPMDDDARLMHEVVEKRKVDSDGKSMDIASDGIYKGIYS